MSINIEQINAFNRLNEFMNFAEASGDANAIAKFDGETGKITTAEGDRIKGLFTWTAPGRDVAANNATRDAFKSSLLTLFGKENVNELPKTVQDVLKAGDYDNSGKPLSARRINAVMTAVKDTKAYLKTESYAKLSNFTEEMFTVDQSILARDVDVGVVKADLKAYVDNVMSATGGALKDVLVDIAGDTNAQGLVKGAMSFVIGVSQFLENGGTFISTTGKMTNERLGNFDEFVPEATRIVNQDDRSISAALDEHLAVCEDIIFKRFPADNPGLKAKDRNGILTNVFAELQKVADRIKIRMAALLNLDRLPGRTNYEKIVRFERQIAASCGQENALPTTDVISTYLNNLSR